MNRRKFLLAVSLALSMAVPAFAGILHRGLAAAPSGGGKSVIQSTIPALSGDFPFANLLRDSSNTWLGNNTTNAGAPIDPSWLDSNGYPLSSALSGTSGVYLAMQAVPAASSKQATAANPFVVTWQGTGPITVGIFNYPLTFVSCGTCTGNNSPSALDVPSGLYKGRIEFYPPSYAVGTPPKAPSFNVSVTAMATGAAFTMNAANAGIELHFLSDETAGYLAGTSILNPQYLAVLQQSKAGLFRAMDWLYTNQSLTTTWATRKSVTYPTYTDDEWRASLYPGDIMTNSGNNYSLTTGSFTLADKLTMHVHFSANDTPSANQTSGFGFASIQCCMTVTGGGASPMQVNWTSHGLSNGQPVGFEFAGNPPAGMCACQTYYVVNATTNSFQVATTSGGSAIQPSTLNSNSMLVTTFDTLSLNGSTAYPIKTVGALPVNPSGFGASAIFGFTGSVKRYGTVVFDNQLQAWLLNGAQNGQSGGLNNSVPVEAFLEACKEIGITPYVSFPFLALDPMTDYVPSFASLIKSTNSAWVPHFEAGNEIWNPQTGISNYAFAKAWVHWDSGTNNTGDWPNWTGMVTSTVGQAVAAVYGAGGLGTSYHVHAGIQTDSAPTTTGTVVDNVMTASAYVASGPAQVGYTQTAASNWVDGVQVSNYVSPALRGTAAEWSLTWDWYYTSSGNPTQQAADLNTYVDGLCGSGCSTNTGYTVPYESVRWQRAHTWAANFGVNKMYAYEGGYSPDLMPTYWDLSSSNGLVQSVFQSTPGSGEAVPISSGANTVIDIRTVNSGEPLISGAQSGNPSVAGMLVYLSAVTGMTELNCNFGSATFTTSPDVTWTAHNLNVNQVVQFSGNNLPSNVTSGQRYFVISTNLATNTFEFSATRGGSAITPAASGSGSVFSAFVVIGTASGGGVGFNNLTTIDVNSSGFPTATSVPYVNFPNSLTLINNFRTATLLSATDMQAQILASYNTFVADGGAFPAQYEVAGSGSIWPPVQPDIWGTQSGELAAITYFNTH